MTKKVERMRRPGTVSITRPRGGDDDGVYVRIIVRTNDDRRPAVCVDIPLAGFAAALMGQGEVPCIVETPAAQQEPPK